MQDRLWHGINKKTKPIGFGCWQIAGIHSDNGKPNGWGEVSEKDAIGILVHAIENGINFFDTAQGYNAGNSERLLGKAMKLTSNDVVVCTKIALNEEEIKNRKIGAHFLEWFELSLSNLQSSHVDILLLHNPPDDIDWNSFDYQVLDLLITKGLIGTYGLSSRSILGAKNAIENNFGTTIEWVFNIFERRPAEALFSQMDEKKYNFIARSPLSRGLINPKYLTTFPAFDANDFRTTLPQEWLEWILSELRKFHKNDIPESEIIKNAILYCLHFQTVKSCIVGIKSKKQLDELLHIKDSLTNQENFNFDLLKGIPSFYPKWA